MPRPLLHKARPRTRTQVDNPKRRKDLLEKMLALDSEAATAEERESGITKLRYMQFREIMSSSATHGWRIEGVRLPSGKGPSTKKLRKHEQLQQALLQYVQARGEQAAGIRQRLVDMREALEASPW